MLHISLSTDFGTGDNYFYSIKLELYKHIKESHIVELNNHLNSFNINDAAYNCRILFEDYPFLKYNIVLYKHFYKKEDCLLHIEYKGRHFFFPNNGLAFLSHKGEFDNMTLWNVTHEHTYIDSIKTIIEIIQGIENKNPISLEKVSHEKINKLNPICSNIQEDYISAAILYIDKKSNIILNLTQNEFEEARQGRNFEIHLTTVHDNPIKKISPYQGTGEDIPVAFYNQYHLLTLSIPIGELARLLGYTDRNYDYSREEAIFYPYYNNNKITITFTDKT